MGQEERVRQRPAVTDAETRDAALMVLAGRVNKSLSGRAAHAWAIGDGLAGGDGNVFRARKKKDRARPGICGRDCKRPIPLWLESDLEMTTGLDLVDRAGGVRYSNIQISDARWPRQSALLTYHQPTALVFSPDVPGVKELSAR